MERHIFTYETFFIPIIGRVADPQDSCDLMK